MLVHTPGPLENSSTEQVDIAHTGNRRSVDRLLDACSASVLSNGSEEGRRFHDVQMFSQQERVVDIVAEADTDRFVHRST